MRAVVPQEKIFSKYVFSKAKITRFEKTSFKLTRTATAAFMGLRTTLSCALFFLVYLSLHRILRGSNFYTAGKYGLLSHTTCLADDTSSIWWLLDFDSRTSCWHTRWRRFYFVLNSLSLVSIAFCGDISSNPGPVSTGLSVLYFNACRW